MVPLASYTSLGEAERAGALLIRHDITADLKGWRLGRGGPVTLYVDEEHFDRARELLSVPSEEPAAEPIPFHPCPSCGTADPIWYGKRKAALFVTMMPLLMLYMFLRMPAFGAIVIGLLALFFIAVSVIPEFECRQCHRRWSRSNE